MNEHNHGTFKLSYVDAAVIRLLHDEYGYGYRQLSKMYGVFHGTIAKVCLNQSWKGNPSGCPSLPTHCRAGHYRTKSNTAWYFQSKAKRYYPQCRICIARTRKMRDDRKRSLKVSPKFVVQTKPICLPGN